MKILHVPGAYPPVLGGAENHCCKLSEALVAKGHSVTVVTSNVGGYQAYYGIPSRVSAEESETRGGVAVRRLPFFHGIDRPLYKLLCLLLPKGLFRRLWGRVSKRRYDSFKAALRRELAAGGYDVVMTMPHDMANVRGVVDIAHTMDFPLVLLPMIHADSFESSKQWHEGAIMRADAVVANTSAEAKVLSAEFRVPDAKIFTGWLGVDLPETTVESGRKRQILCLGRVVRQKCIDSLVKALVLLWEHPSYSDVTLVVAGARAAESAVVEQEIKACAGRHMDKINILYDVEETAKQALLASSSCLVLSSPSESFGLVLIEAMAHRTPVVGLDMPVLRSFIESGKNGLLAAAGSTKALADAIQALLENPAYAREIGSAGYDMARAKFNWSAVADNYVRAYEHAIASRRTPK